MFRGYCLILTNISVIFYYNVFRNINSYPGLTVLSKINCILYIHTLFLCSKITYIIKFVAALSKFRYQHMVRYF